MNASWIQRYQVSSYFWAALGGLAWAASFPNLGIAGLAWIAPGWVLFASLGRAPRDAFRVGYGAGYFFALTAFYWILHVPFPAGAIAGWLALAAYLAVYPAMWCWASWRVFRALAGEHRLDGDPVVGVPLGGEVLWPRMGTSGPPLNQLRAVRSFVAVPVARRVVWSICCAAIWVALEMLLARLFTGFWNLLGVSQYQVLPVIQIVTWTGVYGVSFSLFGFPFHCGAVLLQLIATPAKRGAWLGDLGLPLIVLLVVVAYGSARVSEQAAPVRTLDAVLVQPSIPQTLIWDTNQNALRFQQLINLSAKALQENTNAHLIVWPEAAVPNMLRYEREIYQAVTNLVMTYGAYLILGSDDAVPRPGSAGREADYYNSSFLVTPQGEIAAFYRKRRLVIFGEYIPLERWVPFTKYLTPVGGSFSAGTEPMPFWIPELRTKIGVLICFEDIFPHYTGEYVEADSDFLLNLTNNGWFGESAAQWQHAANAVFRAVENRIPLVRCANNGLTGWVDAWGGLHDILKPNSHDIYGAGYELVRVPLLSMGQRREATFYNQHGDFFGWGCVCLTALLLFFGRGATSNLGASRREPGDLGA